MKYLKFYVILTLSLFSGGRHFLQIQVVMLLSVKHRGLLISLLPLTQMRKGGCSMTLSEVLQLLAVIGGAVFVTFQITWTISNSKKK